MELLKWWGIQGVLHINCENFCAAWDGLSKMRNGKKLWNLILGCTIWSLWYTRNKIKFESVPPNQLKMSYELKTRIGIWAKELLDHADLTPLISKKDALQLFY